MAYRAKATDPRVATLGFMPAIPAMRKYVLVKSKRGEKARAVIEAAALISAEGY